MIRIVIDDMLVTVSYREALNMQELADEFNNEVDHTKQVQVMEKLERYRDMLLRTRTSKRIPTYKTIF